MKLGDINPHIRFAQRICYGVRERTVYVQDCRLFYIVEGHAQIDLEGVCYPLEAHTLFYCRGGSVYTIRCETPFTLVAIDFDLTQRRSDWLQPIPPMVLCGKACPEPMDPCHVQDSPFLNGHLHLPSAMAIKPLVMGIVDHFFKQQFYFREQAGTLLRQILIELHTAVRMGDKDSSITRQILDYIHAHYKEQTDNKSISRQLGYHEYYLNRLFVKYMGNSIHSYLIDLRISEAKRLLLDSDIPVTQIAETVGFRNHTYFSSCFLKRVGIQPSRYRDTYR